MCCRYVQEVAEQHLVVQVSSAIKGRVSILDSAEEPEALSEFSQQFKEGQPIQCRVSQVARLEQLYLLKPWWPYLLVWSIVRALTAAQ